MYSLYPSLPLSRIVQLENLVMRGQGEAGSGLQRESENERIPNGGYRVISAHEALTRTSVGPDRRLSVA